MSKPEEIRIDETILIRRDYIGFIEGKPMANKEWEEFKDYIKEQLIDGLEQAFDNALEWYYTDKAEENDDE